MKVSDLKQLIREELDTAKKKYPQLNEGWKENIIALTMAAAGAIGSAKGQARDDFNSPKLNALNKGAITTVVNTNQKDTLKLDFGAEFSSGRYSFNKDNIGDLVDKLNQIAQFIKAHPGAKFIIEILSSESKVPNFDMEPGSDTYKQRLQVGDLANKRAQAMQVALNTFSKKLNEKGINANFDITQPKTNVGGPDWKQGDNPNDKKFVEHQFVKVNIIAGGDQQKTASFTGFAKDGQSVFSGNALAGIAYFRTSQTGDINQQGNVDGGHEDMLFRFVDRMGKFTGEDYLVPSKWWNDNANIGNAVSSDFLKNVKQIGKKV
jgi:hypothetical protein